MDETLLSPVYRVGNYLFKDDSQFRPIEGSQVNGGKLRQAIYIAKKAKKMGYKGLATGCALLSPQAEIVASVEREMDMECVVFYGGTTLSRVLNYHTKARKVLDYGAKIKIAKSGRNSVLQARAREDSKGRNIYLIKYGMRLDEEGYYDTLSCNVANLPEGCNIGITCGSGNSLKVLLYGLKKYDKEVRSLEIIGNAPNQEKDIKTFCDNYKIPYQSYNMTYHDLYDSKFNYDKPFHYKYYTIIFHPHYEAKTFYYFEKLKLEKPLFWIIGSEG